MAGRNKYAFRRSVRRSSSNYKRRKYSNAIAKTYYTSY